MKPTLLLLLLPSIVFTLLFTVGLLLMLDVSFYTFRPPPQFYSGPPNPGNYVSVATNTVFWYDLWNTVKISAESTILALLFSYPIAQYLVRPGRDLLKKGIIGIVILSLFVNSVVRAAAWITIFGASGAINSAIQGLGLTNRPIDMLFTEFAVVIGITSFDMPYAILTLSSALRFVGLELEDASKTLGANEFLTFRYVTLPLSILPLITSWTLIFVISLAAFVSPAILGGGTVPFFSLIIYSLATDALNYPLSATYSVIFTIVALVALFVFDRVSDVLAKRMGLRPE